MEQRLSLVTLGVADLPRSIRFYEGLGWRRSLQNADGVAFFQLGGLALALFPIADLAADAGVEQAELPAFRGVALAHNVRERTEVDQIVDLVCRLGGSLAKPPEAKVWGGYGAYVTDPDGHLWEIAWNPEFRIDAEGRIVIPD